MTMQFSALSFVHVLSPCSPNPSTLSKDTVSWTNSRIDAAVKRHSVMRFSERLSGVGSTIDVWRRKHHRRPSSCQPSSKVPLELFVDFMLVNEDLQMQLESAGKKNKTLLVVMQRSARSRTNSDPVSGFSVRTGTCQVGERCENHDPAHWSTRTITECNRLPSRCLLMKQRSARQKELIMDLVVLVGVSSTRMRSPDDGAAQPPKRQRRALTATEWKRMLLFLQKKRRRRHRHRHDAQMQKHPKVEPNHPSLPKAKNIHHPTSGKDV
jgi:hypothetical protein